MQESLTAVERKLPTARSQFHTSRPARRPLRDIEIRTALRAHLKARHGADPLCAILDEMEVCHGEARIDLVVANGRLDGFEIKSDCDSLARLAQQVEIYGRVFDRMTVVSGPRYLGRVLEAVPTWWGVMAAANGEEHVRLRQVRRGRANPDRQADHIASLLDREHALALLASRGLDKGIRSKSIMLLRDRCATQVPMRDLRAAARDAVRARAAGRLVLSQR